jgi:4-hydroxy-tetrahydrodipicolinate synthase
MMKTPLFSGAGTALVTPMREDGSVNYEKLEELVDWQIQEGIDALIICGTTGEAPTLEDDEHIECIRVAVSAAAKRVPVIAGTGSNYTDHAVMMSHEAEKVGADGLLMVTPYYNKTTQAGLVKHYTYIADRVSLPIILYNVPSRTGLGFTASAYEQLADHPMINGIKEASGNFTLIAETFSKCGDRLSMWSGNDDQIVPLMSLGGLGVISVASNLVPKMVVEMCQKALTGDFAGAAKMQKDSFRLFNDLFVEVNPMPIKAAMQMAGFNVGPARLPLCELSAASEKKLRDTLAAYDLLKA